MWGEGEGGEMPIFEYICQKCSNEFETLVISKGTDVECPECSSHELTKKMSVSNIKSGGDGAGSSETERSPSSSSTSGCSSCISRNCSTCN